jgi:DNA polymerase III sliding clamp (beta) subunit (PCNA family)
MRLTAKAGAIGSALSLAAAARQRDALISIVAGEGITVTCSGPVITIRTVVAGDVVEQGRAAVSAARLVALIAGFATDAAITITTIANAVTIERYRLPSADIPIELALADEIARVELSGHDCLELLAVGPAAGTEPTRLYLNGIFLHSVGDQLTAVATDGVKLIRSSVAAERFSTGRDLIVPTKATIALAKLIRQTKADKIVLRRSRTLLAASGTGFEFVTRLLDFQYPTYEPLVPAPSANAVTCDRAEMQAALVRLTAVVSGDSPLIALTWSDGGPLHLYLPRQPADGADDVGAGAKGSARIALAPSQLAAMLGEFNCKRIHLNAAGRLLITGENHKLGLLMPCAWDFQNEKEEASAAVA